MDEAIIPAVDVSGLYKSYNKKSPVLQGVHLFVRQGHIYGLLGPSGCGKTTLLKLIIGRLQPDSGRVKVLGYTPGTVESRIPGNRVGYMPQELALYQMFTISETLHFFGRVQGMKTAEIMARMMSLLELLNLPSAERKIEQLSGGQQRRVSLAIALLHRPEILILDEPTVGVDPLLREKIWDHLVDLSTNDNTTVIITTHYIEEARSAHCVGLMRNGRLLAEGHPDQLLTTYNQETLEKVFLTLCMHDEQKPPSAELPDRKSIPAGEVLKLNGSLRTELNSNEPTLYPSVADDDDVPMLGSDTETRGVERAHRDEKPCSSSLRNCRFVSAMNLLALVIKNIHIMRKRIPLLLFQFLLPAIQITLFAFCIGGTPQNLDFQVVNLDAGYQLLNSMNISVSEAFLAGVDPAIVRLHYTPTTDAAQAAVENGSAWGMMTFHHNFSMDTILKMEGGTINPDVLQGANIDIALDETNQQITMTIKSKIVLAYQSLFDNLKKQVKKRYNTTLPIDPGQTDIPISYTVPIFGTDSGTFLDFVAPGMICSIIFSQSVGLTALALVIERKEGLFERSLISGIIVAEVMIGQILTQFLIMAMQTTVLLVFAFFLYNVYNIGSAVVITLFALMLGLSGMCLGFLISAVASNEQEATQMSLASVMPSLLVSGILWPLEAMPIWLQDISVCLPLTLSVQGLRAVLGRGWDFLNYEVWSGFVVGTAWAFGFLLLSLLVTKLKKIG